MIELKTNEEIRIMEEGARRLKIVLVKLKPSIKPGITTKQINEIADKLIKKVGGEASFKKVKGYHWATCLSINEQVVHTPPSPRAVKDGDLLTIDIGLYYQGFHCDYADSFIVGRADDPRLTQFLKVGKETLVKATKKFKKNNHLGDVSHTIEAEINGHGYFVIKQLTGHGIGRQLHEDPYILGYLDRPINKTSLIKPGLVVAIEVIYSMGSEEVVYKEGDKWSLVTKDGSTAACFEHTVAITDKDTVTLT